MSRFSTVGNARRLARSLLPRQNTSCLEIKNNESEFVVALPSFLCRLYSQYKLSNKGLTQYKLCKTKENLWKSYSSKNFYFVSASNTISHRAHIAWKSISQICSYTGPVLPPINRIACAVSLALTRSQVVAPGIFAFIIGELAWTQRTWAEAERFPTGNTLYMHAQDGHVFLTSFVYSLVEGLILFLRAIYLAILFSPCIAIAPFADHLGTEFRKNWLRIVHFTLEKAGPAFIKWGQWAATRPDLFPKDLCTELAKLQTKAPAHSYAYTKRTIEKAFSRKLHDIFENFEEKPVASGSVAQIHRATLKFRYPGQRIKPMLVAVKVRHPGVGDAIRRDFVLINLVAKVSKFIPTLKWLRLDDSIQQFTVFMMSQVDLAREAANLSRFIYNFRRWKDVSFPKPLYPLVHPAVLVETYEHGENVLYYVDELGGHERIKSALAHIGTHALLKMLLVDNFIHADMHPGNILVRTSRNRASSTQLFKSRPHVIFLDVGMTAELSRKDRVTLLEFFKAVALRDGRAAAECTLKLSKQQNCPNPDAFIKEVEQTFGYWGSTEGDFIHPAECMQQMLEQVRRHRVNVDGDVCTVMVTMLVLEGWQRKLDPEYDVMHTLQALLFKSEWAESLYYTIEGLMAP
ncbi:ABC1 family protein like [Actinidia chinensis var. chinensis]|uniref:ABC1 family protein like n=1 Tax=Actinidia chinensis var. chinensis TaxID=1590841 RepID=A0A2R6PRG9_ACTCC|nr:ABC1 family protein like [Actinidia chinensis var. chinensis]